MVKKRTGSEDIKDKVKYAELMYREFTKYVLPRLKAEADETKRYLLFIAWLNKKLEGNGLGRIIITGGFAVEVYTGRTYRTMDVDIIVEGLQAADVVREFLTKFSERIGRGYLMNYESLDVKSIDIVSYVYTRKVKPVKLIVNNDHVYLEPPEELIITYLLGWKNWGSTEDRDKALWVYIVWKDKLDEDYLVRRVIEEGINEKFKELKELALAKPIDFNISHTI